MIYSVSCVNRNSYTEGGYPFSVFLYMYSRYTIAMKQLEKAIIATIVYYDVFDYPLTVVELWKWLIMNDMTGQRSVSIYDIQQALMEDILQLKLEVEHGFYYLKGRQTIITTRMDRYRLAERKYQRAKKIIRRLRFIPFVKMIGVCNTLAYNNSRPQADIDLFIITTPGRIWLVRFFVAGFLKVFGLRPSQTHTQDTLCASFFTDTQHLNMEKLTIADDIYLPYWVAQVVPVYDEGVYASFVSENSWIEATLPQTIAIDPPARRTVPTVRWIKWLFTIVVWLIPEKVFREYQMKVMPHRLRTMANTDTRVVVNDTMLKFHDTDRRQYFLDEWHKRMAVVL